MIEGTPTGHRTIEHTADLILEAWAPSRVECLAEAVRALVGTFADARDATVERSMPVALDAALDEDLAVALLEDVLYLLDADDAVVAGVELEETEDGSLEGTLELVPAAAVEPVGAVPKGVSRSDLLFERAYDGWHCRFIVDV